MRVGEMWNGEWRKEAIDRNNGFVTNYRSEDYSSFAYFLCYVLKFIFVCSPFSSLSSFPLLFIYRLFEVNFVDKIVSLTLLNSRSHSHSQ